MATASTDDAEAGVTASVADAAAAGRDAFEVCDFFCAAALSLRHNRSRSGGGRNGTDTTAFVPVEATVATGGI